MKVYKIKHIPTGLYFTPSKGSGNLSINGKVYVSRPNLDWCKTIRVKFHLYKDQKPNKRIKSLLNHFALEPKYGTLYDQYFKTNQSEWEIIEL